MKTTIIIISFFFVTEVISQNYGNWNPIDSLSVGRTGHAMVVLHDGNILVSGDDNIDTAQSTRSCEIYDIATNSWHETTSLHQPKALHHMKLLDNGEVLAYGGIFNKSCEIYNPNTEKWRFTDSMLIARDYISSGLSLKLNDGRILIMGGNALKSDRSGYEELISCEIFDPITEKWAFVDPLLLPIPSNSAIKLKDGNVLVAGSKYCQLYNVEENRWEMTDSLVERGGGSAMLMLDNNNVLLVGGGCPIEPCDIPIDKRCAIFNTETNKWSYVGEISARRRFHSVFKISDEYIIIIGGDIFNNDTWEIYDIEEYKAVYHEPFEGNYFITGSNTIQKNNGDILIVGGYKWSDTSGIPTVFISKDCFVFDITTSVNIIEEDIVSYHLCQNYPNPFNPTTTISYQIPNNGFVNLVVYNSLGQEVAVLVESMQKVGNYMVQFNAENYSSGIYYYKLIYGAFAETKKMMLLK